MDRMDAIAWVMRVGSTLRLSQVKTLSELVAAALSVGRVSLSEIGRQLTGDTLAKSRIQRVYNTRVVVSDVVQGIMTDLKRSALSLSELYGKRMTRTVATAGRYETPS